MYGFKVAAVAGIEYSIAKGFVFGTNLTNDTGFEPSNIVMKLTQCKMNVNQEWRECIKPVSYTHLDVYKRQGTYPRGIG